MIVKNRSRANENGLFPETKPIPHGDGSFGGDECRSGTVGKIRRTVKIGLRPRMIMSKKHVHVVPHSNGWATKVEGNARASSIHDTQKDAIAAGRTIAMQRESELRIHGRDGKLREGRSYGRDPFPPAG